jgi:hypothetical protein
MKTKLFFIGIVVVALTGILGFAGCSGDTPLAPTSATVDNSGNVLLSPTDTQPRDQQDMNFRLAGDIVAIDINKPLVVLSAKTESDRSVAPMKYYLDVSKNATVVLLDGRTEVPFDAKYVPIGANMVVTGSVLTDGTMIAERFEVWQIDPAVSINPAAL